MPDDGHTPELAEIAQLKATRAYRELKKIYSGRIGALVALYGDPANPDDAEKFPPAELDTYLSSLLEKHKAEKLSGKELKDELVADMRALHMVFEPEIPVEHPETEDMLIQAAARNLETLRQDARMLQEPMIEQKKALDEARASKGEASVGQLLRTYEATKKKWAPKAREYRRFLAFYERRFPEDKRTLKEGGAATTVLDELDAIIKKGAHFEDAPDEAETKRETKKTKPKAKGPETVAPDRKTWDKPGVYNDMMETPPEQETTEKKSRFFDTHGDKVLSGGAIATGLGLLGAAYGGKREPEEELEEAGGVSTPQSRARTAMKVIGVGLCVIGGGYLADKHLANQKGWQWLVSQFRRPPFSGLGRTH